jgi:8-oxo-dGTP diphosphatase
MEGNRPLIALIRTAGNELLQLPKGIGETGESLSETAVREVREETGLDAGIVRHLRRISYRYSADYGKGLETFDKTVDFFLMRYESGDISDHDNEVVEVRWVDLDTAPELMLYPAESEILQLIPRVFTVSG